VEACPSIPLQRVTSLRRRAQANAPAASHWLQRLRAPRLDESIVQRVPAVGGGACNVVVVDVP